MGAATVALRPENEAPRRSARTKRGATIILSSNSNSNPDSITRLRLQRLSRSWGITGTRADLLARMIWGEASEASA